MGDKDKFKNKKPDYNILYTKQNQLYWSEQIQYKYVIQDLRKALKKLGNVTDPRVQDIIIGLEAIQGMTSEFAGDEVKRIAYGEVAEQKKVYENTLELMQQMMLNPSKNISDGDKAAIDLLKDNVPFILNNQQYINEYFLIVENRDKLAKSFVNGEFGAEVNQLKGKVSIPPQQLPITKLYDISIYNSSVEDVMQHLLWCQRHISACQKDADLNQQLNQSDDNYYIKAYWKLIEELQTAPPEYVSKYSQTFIKYDALLKDKAYEKYSEYLDNAPQDRDAEEYAHEMLNTSDEFEMLQSFLNLQSEMWNNASKNLPEGLHDTDPTMFSQVEQLYFHTFEVGGGGNYDIHSVPDREFVSELVHGGMDKYLKKNKTVEDFEKEKQKLASNAKQLIKTSKIFKDGMTKDLAELYKTLINDKREASDSFTRMRDGMTALLSMDISHPEKAVHDEKFMSAFNEAYSATIAYKNSHNRFHFTQKGDDRLDLSKKMLTCLGKYQSILNVEKHRGEEQIVKSNDDKQSLQQKVSLQIKHYTEAIKAYAMKGDNAKLISATTALIHMQRIKMSAHHMTENELRHSLEQKSFTKQADKIKPEVEKLLNNMGPDKLKVMLKSDDFAANITKSYQIAHQKNKHEAVKESGEIIDEKPIEKKQDEEIIQVQHL